MVLLKSIIDFDTKKNNLHADTIQGRKCYYIMSTQTSMHGEIKEQHQKLKDMTLKGKLSYFWDYYRIHTLVILSVTVLVALFIYQVTHNKDYAFYAVVMNADTNCIEDGQWCDEFAEYAQIDTDEYAVALDTSFIYSSSNVSQYTVSSMEKLLVMVQTKLIDVITADTEAFENYAQNELFLNLETALPEAVLEQYKDHLYYTDASTFGASDAAFEAGTEQPDPSEYIIDHRDPSSMEKPVPVGIYLPEGNRLSETGCYEYLEYNETTYQGFPSKAVLGIPVTCAHLDTVLQFLAFLEE